MDSDLCLHDWGLSTIELRPYQIEGVKWFIKCIKNNHGGILGDEMGLGKTIQTICAVLSYKNVFQFKKFIIISPLSVIGNWSNELTKFTPNMKFLVYMNSKSHRTDLRNSSEWASEEMILITTYEYFIQDFLEISLLNFDVLFMDEGHRIKNNESILYQRVKEIPLKYRFLLTGTPIQNNLDELYNLLTIVTLNNINFLPNRHNFTKDLQSRLSQSTADIDLDGVLAKDPLLGKLLIRRTKAEVLQNLPDKMQVVIFHGLTPLQKELYKSFLMKDIESLKLDGSADSPPANKFSNILMQLRKCVLHPYLFAGIEKEPFELGEHIVEYSEKLHVLDKLLKYLMPLGHKILIFSQMSKMLDLIQDYCFLRGFHYERLDGSVRSEERFAAITNFSSIDTTRLFLLTTRAGGQGINLTAADTVIFVDSDFNPQADLQAMARIHRPGQKRPCRTIRLVVKHSVEEIIVSRAQQKLQMTRGILGHEEQKTKEKASNLREMVCYGIDKLFTDDSENSSPLLSDEFFTSILGGTDSEGHWEPIESDVQLNNAENVNANDHIYLFEGWNYKPKPSKKDYQTIADMAQLKEVNSTNDSNGKVRKGNGSQTNSARKKSESSESKVSQRKIRLWKDNNYVSQKIESTEDDDDVITNSNDLIGGSESGINFVIGDVTSPIGNVDQLKIICHLVDNSGSWGSGGLFSALDRINSNIAVEYLRAGEMEDLNLGDCHLYRLQANTQVALMVAQSRDKSGRISPIKMNHLETCLVAVRKFALANTATLHLTRLGYKTPQFNWYGIEKLIEKHFSERGIETFIYYFRRGQNGISPTIGNQKLSATHWLSILTGIVVYFHKSVDRQIAQVLKRHIYALDGEVANDVVDSRITHVLVSDDQSFIDKDAFEEVSFLKLSWLAECIKKRARIPEINFSI